MFDDTGALSDPKYTSILTEHRFRTLDLREKTPKKWIFHYESNGKKNLRFERENLLKKVCSQGGETNSRTTYRFFQNDTEHIIEHIIE